MAYPFGCKSSGLKTSDAAISAPTKTVGTRLWGAVVIADGTNAANVILYDNASAASGTVLLQVNVAAGGVFDGGVLPVPITCTNGIYADVGGTNAKYIVYYE